MACKSLVTKLIRMFGGFLVLAFAISLIYQANIGLSAWDVLNDGFSKSFGVKFGDASIWVGLVVLSIGVISREKLGIGTVLNMIFIGKFVNIILDSGFILQATNLWVSLAMAFLGMLLQTFGLYLYISAGLGAGPRDTFLVSITRRTGLAVGTCRGIIEITVVVLGYFLGGAVGIGTVMMALLTAPVTQIMWRLLRFDIKQVNHLGILQTFSPQSGG